MARYFLIKIGTQYLTRNGLVGGTPCKVAVPNFDALILDKTGSVQTGRDGTPFSQVVDTGQKGIEQEIQIQSVTQDVWDQLITELQAAVDGGDTLVLEIDGDPGSFSGNCSPLLPKPASAGRFSGGYIRDAVIRVITA